MESKRLQPDTPIDVDRGFKIEMAVILVALNTFAVFLFLEAYFYAVLLLIASLFAFGIWRIGQARFE
jgi:hypothetical protein